MTVDSQRPSAATDGDEIARREARIAELERIVEENARLSTLNLFVKTVNAALFDFREPEEVLDRICRRAVTDAGFIVAWVGVQDDRRRRVAPMCAHGPAAGFASELVITLDPDLATSRCPTRRCMVERRTVYVDDFLTDPTTQPWRDLAVKYGIRSSASAPLIVRGRARRAVTFYSSTPGYFDVAARAVLDECVERISLTLAAHEAEQELTSRNRLLTEMSAMAVVGGWEMDARTRKVTGSREAAAILDLDEAGEFQIDDVLGLFSTADAASLEQGLKEALAAETRFDLQVRLRPGAAKSKWLRVVGAGEKIRGRIARIFGAVQDITAHRQRDLALTESYRFNQLVLDSISDEIAVLDKDGVIIAVNGPWRRFAAENAPPGADTLSTVDVGANYLDAGRAGGPPDDELAEAIRDGVRSVLDRRLPVFQAEYPCHTPTRERWFSMRVTPMQLGAGAAVVVHSDITARREAEAVLAESEDRFRSLTTAMTEGVVLQDEHAVILAFNDSATRILGLTADQLRGRSSFDPRWRAIREDGSPFDGAAHPVPETLRTGAPQANVVMGIHKPDGGLTWISISAQPLFKAGSPKPYRAVATMVDITEYKRIQAELIRAARYDPLTGLLNRAAFTETVRAAMEAAEPGRPPVAVVLLDLDNFKDVNDTLGHDAGDALLKALSDRLAPMQGPECVVARFGGDEFGVLVRRFAGLPEIEATARGLLDTINRPVSFAGVEMRVGASIGVAIGDPRMGEAQTLFSRADLALYRAKSQGRGLIRFFTEAMDVEVRRRVTLGRELHFAIDSGELRLVYQPQVDARSGAIIGLEALARWDHPERGLVGPGEFIPIAESLGLAPAIGRWVINEACRQIRAWLDLGLSPPPVAVNLSATHFVTPGELERDLDDATTRHRVQPSDLELELTETVLMESAADHNDTLMRLRRRGFSLSIDDFGTGYSSLDYVRRLPADRIKIDQKFVNDIDATPGAEAIVKAVIGLARQLGMGVIAEGVETQVQRDLLRQWDCWQMQGYWFSRPETSAVLTSFLETRRLLP